MKVDIESLFRRNHMMRIEQNDEYLKAGHGAVNGGLI